MANTNNARNGKCYIDSGHAPIEKSKMLPSLAQTSRFFWLVSLALGYYSDEELEVLTVSTNLVFKEPNHRFESVYIKSQGRTDFVGARDISVDRIFQNLGIYYQTCGDDQYDQPARTELSGHFKLNNMGLFVYDYRKAKVAPTFLFGRGSESFLNRGEMWFGVGGQARAPEYAPGQPNPREVDVSLSTEVGFHNEGFIFVSGTAEHKVSMNLKFRMTDLQSYYGVANEGIFFLSRSVWKMTEKLTGSGCIVVTDSSELFLPDMKVISSHMIHMDPAGSDAAVHIEVSGQRTWFFLRVSGLTKSCFIHFSKTMSGFMYNAEKGELCFSAKEGKYTHILRVGSNYKQEDFKFDGQTLSVNRDVEGEIPEGCQCRHNMDDMIRERVPGAFVG